MHGQHNDLWLTQNVVPSYVGQPTPCHSACYTEGSESQGVVEAMRTWLAYIAAGVGQAEHWTLSDLGRGSESDFGESWWLTRQHVAMLES